MQLTINSRKLGRTLTFTRPSSYYIYVDINGHSGALGYQICGGGKLMGDTIGYRGETEATFESICRRWYRKYIKNIKSLG